VPHNRDNALVLVDSHQRRDARASPFPVGHMEQQPITAQTTQDDFVVTIDQELWRVHVVKIYRVAPDWYAQFAAVGPRTCMIFVRMSAPPSDRQECRPLVGRLLESLSRGDRRACVFIDLVEAADDAISGR
jgi:hypothetical protein